MLFSKVTSLIYFLDFFQDMGILGYLEMISFATALSVLRFVCDLKREADSPRPSICLILSIISLGEPIIAAMLAMSDGIFRSQVCRLSVLGEVQHAFLLAL